MPNPIERLSQVMQQEAAKKADLFLKEIPKIVQEGNFEGAALVAEATSRELHTIKIIDDAFTATLDTFKQAGISLPSEEIVYEAPPTKEKKKVKKKKEPTRTLPIPETEFPSLRLMPENKTIVLDGKEYKLSDNEWIIISHLKNNASQWIGARDLVETVFGSSDERKRRDLTQTLYEFRKRIGESAKEPRLIHTKPGRNAAFILTAKIEETLGSETKLDLSPLDINILSKSMHDGKMEDTMQLEDIQELERIINKSSVETGDVPEELKNSARQELLNRMTTNNLEVLFNANEGNEDAQFLLTILAGDDFHSKVTNLLNYSVSQKE